MSVDARIYDMHCHLHEYSLSEVEEILSNAKDTVIVAVSEDVESFLKTIEYYQIFPERIIPCAGFHPWSIRERSLSEAEELARLAVRHGIACIGEVGLDAKFLPLETWDAQVKIVRLFLRTASEIDAYVTLHAPNAWRPLLEILVEEGVRKAMFHWYTGPLNLIDEIVSYGYKISLNPAIKIQEKHRKVARHAPLESIVFESDGPYKYRGLRLDPRMIPESIKIVAELRGTKPETVAEAARENSARLLYG